MGVDSLARAVIRLPESTPEWELVKQESNPANAALKISPLYYFV